MKKLCLIAGILLALLMAGFAKADPVKHDGVLYISEKYEYIPSGESVKVGEKCQVTKTGRWTQRKTCSGAFLLTAKEGGEISKTKLNERVVKTELRWDRKLTLLTIAMLFAALFFACAAPGLALLLGSGAVICALQVGLGLLPDLRASLGFVSAFISLVCLMVGFDRKWGQWICGASMLTLASTFFLVP